MPNHGVRTPGRLFTALLVPGFLGPVSHAEPEPPGPLAGYDGRFHAVSERGHRLDFDGEFQFRYLATFGSNADPDDGSRATLGFETRRMRLRLQGNAPDVGIRYGVMTNIRSSDGTMVLLDAWVDRDLGEGATLRIGQFTMPFTREHDVSPMRQLTADRSITNAVYTLDRSQGVQLGKTDDRWRVRLAVSDGTRTLNTAFDSPDSGDVALTGRVEARVGEAPWSQFNDFTSWRGGDSGLLLGAAAHWQRDGHTGVRASDDDGRPRADTLSWTTDLSFEGDGWNLFGAFVARHTDRSGGPTLNDCGLVVHGGAFIAEQLELFARYDAVFPDSDRGENASDFNAVTVGLNHYLIPQSHAAKLTADVTVYLDAPTESSALVRSPSSAFGLIPSDSAGQAAVRLQMQVLF